MSIPIGPHSMEIDGDTVIVRLHGAFVLDHTKEFCRRTEKILGEHGRVFTISDFRSGGTFPSDSRRYALEWSHTHTVSGTAVFGISRTAHVALTLLIRASSLVGRQVIPMTTVPTEAEARAWVAERRLEWEARRASGSSKR